MSSNERPTSQLGKADRDIADLVKRCWHATPRRRPAFDEVRPSSAMLRANLRGGVLTFARVQIVEELEEMRSHRSGAE